MLLLMLTQMPLFPPLLLMAALMLSLPMMSLSVMASLLLTEALALSLPLLSLSVMKPLLLRLPRLFFSQGDGDHARDAEPEDKDSLKDRIMGESGSVASEDEQSIKKGSTVSNGSDASEDEESSKKGDAMEDVMQPVSRHQLIPRKAKQSVCYKEASKNKVECVNDSDGSSFVAPEDDMNSKECPRSKASLTSHLCSRGQ
jgi:hypothetical protein